MHANSIDEPRFFLGRDLPSPEACPIAAGVATVFTTRCPDKETVNEDAVALMPCGQRSGVIAVADGFGGQPAGEQAAQLALEKLAETLDASLGAGASMRAGILDGFEKANEVVQSMGVGAATTLAVLEIDDGRARSYHVGDTMALIVGQRGKVKLQTVSHSPVGYAVEAGLLGEDEALHHEDRHIVSNMVGAPDMRIEIGSSLKLRPRDTVLIASDGLFDNLVTQDILQVVRKGPLTDAADILSAQCDRRMRSPAEGQPSKPDDLTFVLYRRRA
jgi:serine/threonine protein phosphatase PrpC